MKSIYRIYISIRFFFCIFIISLAVISSAGAADHPAFGEIRVIDLSVPLDEWEEFITGDPEDADKVPVAMNGNKGTLVYHGNPHSLKRYVKRSLRASFSESVGDKSVEHTLVFKADVSDRTLIREWLGYMIFSEAGITSPSSEHVLLKVNGKTQGIYILIEPVNRYSVSLSFPENADKALLYYGDAHRYKRGIVKPDLFRIDSPVQLRAYTPVITDTDTDNIRLQELLLQINTESLDLKKAASVMDLDEWARWIAVSEIIENKDSPWNSGMRNFSLFHPPDGKWQILPWDTDRIYRGLDCYFPASKLSGIRNLTANKDFKEKVRDNINELINGLLSEESMLKFISDAEQLLKPAIAAGYDPLLTLAKWEAAVNELKQNIHKRHIKLKGLLLSNAALEPMCIRKRLDPDNSADTKLAK